MAASLRFTPTGNAVRGLRSGTILAGRAEKWYHYGLKANRINKNSGITPTERGLFMPNEKKRAAFYGETELLKVAEKFVGMGY